MIKRMLAVLPALILVGVTTCGLLSCKAQPPYQKAFDSMVEVGKSPIGTHEPIVVSLGQCVGDGSQVITILNYEDANRGDYSLDDLWVNRQRTTVQAIDPRTGTTLLSIPGTKLQVAQTGDTSKLKPGQNVIVQGQSGAIGLAVSAPATITDNISSLFFEVNISKEAIQANEGWTIGQGAAVTDKQGRILGLVGASYNRLIPGKTLDNSIVPVVSINSILELLSPDASQQPGAAGPAVSALATSKGLFGYTSGILTSVSDYNRMTAAVQELVGQLGKPLGGDELPGDYPDFVSGFPQNADGTLLTLVYPGPIELRSPESGLVVNVQGWIGLQWGCDGKPNRLFYGFTPYLVAGGFELNGDLTSLEAAVGGVK